MMCHPLPLPIDAALADVVCPLGLDMIGKSVYTGRNILTHFALSTRRFPPYNPTAPWTGRDVLPTPRTLQAEQIVRSVCL